MALTINTNLQSLNSQRALTGSQSSLSTSMARLSSGLRVNSAKDDAAGLAIAERMNAQVKGMNVAIRNANDGISYAQTAEGALGKVGENLQRMRELAVQAANGTNGTVDVGSMGKEYAELKAENTRLIDGTKFNGTKVFNGAAGGVTFQIGAGTAAAVDQITVAVMTIT
ncbi:MAG: flagellin FliC, partial [Stenotrophomonas sp.]